MKERPILFSAPMIRALLDGSKTQTRCIAKLMEEYPPAEKPTLGLLSKTRTGEQLLTATWVANNGKFTASFCPYGKPGDRLWVREAFGFHHEDIMQVSWRADGNQNPFLKWRPSIHMPRWASRITLEITGVRVERLQDISEEDAKTEGCERLDFEREEQDFKICPECGGTRLHNAPGANMGVIFDVDCTQCDTYKKRYRHLWEFINSPGSWAANPWVWVLSFKQVQP